MRYLLLALACLCSPLSIAKEEPIYTGFFSNVAVGGYDVVAYFTEGKPVKGDKAFHTMYLDAEFRFSSAGNKALFDENPAKYAPQYGGYCAWAVSQGYTAKGDPDYWRIVDGKLYLNYDEDVQRKWETDIPGFIDSANRNWPSVLK